MLDMTLDLITETASSSLLAFCFCNLIIVIVLVGLKPGSEFEQEERRTTPPLAVSATGTNEKEVLEDSRDEDCEYKAVCDDNNDVDDGDDDDDDDELRKRVEEFIEKVNRGWKAELSKTSQLV